MMRETIIVLTWITAVFAVIAIPIINNALFTLSFGLLCGALVGVVASNIFDRFTVFEASLGWLLGALVFFLTTFMTWDYLINI